MNKWLYKIKEKVIKSQNNIMTFSDNFHRYILSTEDRFLTEQELKAKNVVKNLTDFRFCTFSKRKESNIVWPENSFTSKIYSQGVYTCMKWKDRPLFKTTYDLAILNMLLWELKPGCIVEIGSGNGSSAEYLKDITKLYGLNTKIVSFDIKPVDVELENVTFITGDCNNINVLNCLNNFITDRPTLFIEDAHVNVLNVINKMLNFAKPGDYFFVEDSDTKNNELEKILSQPGLLLDQHYLDFFGKNCSSSYDGIFKVTVDFLRRPLYNEYTIT